MTSAYTAKITGHLESGNVGAAVEAALAQVKELPGDSDARRLLVDLLIVAGDFERADKQADILSKTVPDLTLGMSLLRGRLRAANARSAWFSEGAVPAFPEGPTERDKLAMEVAIAQRGGDDAAAAAALQSLTAVSETGPIAVNGTTVDGFRDADDRVPHALEVLCTDGSYMWVDHALVEKVAFAPVKSVRDLAWRPATLALKEGSETEVVVCATYFAPDATDAHKLARETDWTELAGGVAAGKGQKAYLSGDDALYALDLQTIAAPALN